MEDVLQHLACMHTPSDLVILQIGCNVTLTQAPVLVQLSADLMLLWEYAADIELRSHLISTTTQESIVTFAIFWTTILFSVAGYPLVTYGPTEVSFIRAQRWRKEPWKTFHMIPNLPDGQTLHIQVIKNATRCEGKLTNRRPTTFTEELIVKVSVVEEEPLAVSSRNATYLCLRMS